MQFFLQKISYIIPHKNLQNQIALNSNFVSP